jgi:carbon monoxide dehydrogenase subunit G
MNTTIEGPQISTAKSAEDLFNFLANPANFESLMPDDVAKFESGADWFIFGLKGLPEVKLRMKEQLPHQSITLEAASSKLEFELKGLIQPDGNGSKVQLLFEGQFNPMLKMMVERPLRNFIEKLSEKISTL